MQSDLSIRVGLESHIQLNSKSKLFCGCANPVALGKSPEDLAPNSLVCDYCLGLPGTKPRFNRAVLEMALKISLALNCNISPKIFFSRKTYFYPDMSKNYQITQYEIPLGQEGYLEIMSDDGNPKKIRIRRIHIEEDPARLVHVGGVGGDYVLVDYNRSGMPLVEIVTEPDIGSSTEARRYLTKLLLIIEYLGVYAAESPAVFKSDANISIMGGERVETKNITGTLEIEKALNYEIVRQQNELRRGRKIQRETRAWDPAFGATKPLRIKEEEAEYGYIFDSDLTPIEISKDMIMAVIKSIPELPDAKRVRFVKQYSISETLADGLVSDIAIAELFERASKIIKPKTAASWIAGPLLKTLNWHNMRWAAAVKAGVRESWLFDILKRFEAGELTKVQAEQLLRAMIDSKEDPVKLAEKLGVEKVVAKGELEMIVEKVLGANQKAVAEFKSGKQKALEFLVGQVVREAKGAADAKTVRDLILKLIKT